MFGAGGSGSFGGTGGTAPVKTSEQQQTSQSGQYFQDPALAQGVAGAAGGLAQDLAGSYKQLITDPTASPTFQNALSGMLAALHPGEQAGRRSLADTFRAAGNTASSTYAKGAAGLESGYQRNRAELGSNLLAKLYPSMAQAAFAPIGQADSLINALKMNQQTSQGTGASYGFPPSTGGGGGGGGGSVGQMGNPLAFTGVNPGAGTSYRRSSPNSYFTGPSATYDIPQSGGGEPDSSGGNWEGWY
jgi:hypothetical protein